MAQAELNHNKGILKSLQDKLQNPESNIAPREWDEIAELLSMGIMDKTAFTEMLTGLIGDEAPYLVSFSEIERNGDASYRANKEAKMMSLSVTADLLKLSSPSVKRQRDLLRKRYREFLKDYEKNKEKFTEDDKQTITQLGKVLEDRYLDSLSFADSLGIT